MLEKGITTVRDFIWGTPLLVALLGTGTYLMLLLHGLPIRKLFPAVRMVLTKNENDKAEEKGISSFASLATELAATIGTGNVIGVVFAITIGGPGALLWMNVSAVLGLATKLVESTLSVKYRMKGEGDVPVGGPMVTLERAFPNKKVGKRLAVIYSILVISCCFGMGNMVQSNSIGETLKVVFGLKKSKIGFWLAVVTVFAVIGGGKLIARIATFLVPAMGALYLAACLGIILSHPENILPAISEIWIGAFSPQSVSGGLFGVVTASFFRCVGAGVSRGVFSNEAGLGAAGISAATARENSYVKQGFVSMTGVFFDTMVICTVTGLAFSVSGVSKKAAEGMLILKNGAFVGMTDPAGLMSAAFETTFGRYGSVLLGTCMTLFAFATILGWAVQGEIVFTHLFGKRSKGCFRLIYVIATFLGTCGGLELIWNLSDVANGLLIVPNLICTLALAPETCMELRKEKLI